jgi:hypothetical protein
MVVLPKGRSKGREVLSADVLYGEDGKPVAWIARDRCLYLFDGTPAAWIARSGDVHAFDGRYLGWLQDGALWDREGRCALFSSQSGSSPPKPTLRPEPARTEPRRTPDRQAPEVPPNRPRRCRQWADVTDEGFFCPPSPDDLVRKRRSHRSPPMR